MFSADGNQVFEYEYNSTSRTEILFYFVAQGKLVKGGPDCVTVRSRFDKNST